MSSEYVDIDMSEFEEFFDRMDRAAKGDFRKEVERWLEAIGNDFLRVVQDEIIRRKMMNSRVLPASFEKGSSGNSWELTEGGLTLEVGTNVSYAKYVHDGHWTNTKGVARRWVPGYWSGDQFIYDPSADTGMLLKQKWVPGQPFLQSALMIYEKVFQTSLEDKLQEWLDTYFGM